MNFLILGSGGREHAMAWKLKQSSLCDQLFFAPGNAGTALLGKNVDVSVTDFEGIKNLCLKHDIQLVIPGPEVPLVEGIVDFFHADEKLKSIPVVGPSKAAAQLEGSKAFAKSFMKKHGIPTATYAEFTLESFEQGKEYIKQHSLPIVLKADGLAAGKGVLICQSKEEALTEFEGMIKSGKFGTAGSKVVIEEFLDGIELSVFILTDGKDYLILPEAKDYKRIGEGDTGLNTGGMGAVSAVPFCDASFMKKIEEKIIKLTIKGLQEDQLNYTGFIFLGLIKVGEEPWVIEYNCRMGDPESEVVFPRLKNDLAELFVATAEKRLHTQKIVVDERQGATVILVSGGYPEKYQKGFEITVPSEVPESSTIFYSGAILKEDQIVTNGGRVMAVTSLSESLESALTQSQLLAEKIQFKDKYYRKDIGWEFTE